MSANQEALRDLEATLEWANQIEWSDEERSAFGPLCNQLSGSVPLPLLMQEREKRRQVEKRAKELEARVAELELALKASREWLRTKPRLAR